MSSSPSHHRSKASPPDTSSLLSLLPEIARSLASPLPCDDQEVLSYLVACGPRVPPAGELPSHASAGKSVWKTWKTAKSSGSDAGSKVGSTSTLTQLPDVRWMVGERTGRKAAAATHKPTFGCDCFGCYSKFWSRWNASPNRETIDEILDFLDHYLDEISLGDRTDPVDHKKGQDKKHLSEQDLAGRKEHGGRRGRLSWQKRGASAKIKSEKEKLQTVAEETEASVVVKKNGSAEGVDKETDLSCHLQEIPPTQEASSIEGNLSLNGKNSPKQRGGKRKSKQVTPLDCEGSQAVQEEGEAVVPGGEVPNANSNSTVLRVEDANLRGRGFLGRVFPDALGGVATRLWELVSLRMRSHTMDFY